MGFRVSRLYAPHTSLLSRSGLYIRAALQVHTWLNKEALIWTGHLRLK